MFSQLNFWYVMFVSVGTYSNIYTTLYTHAVFHYGRFESILVFLIVWQTIECRSLAKEIDPLVVLSWSWCNCTGCSGAGGEECAHAWLPCNSWLHLTGTAPCSLTPNAPYKLPPVRYAVTNTYPAIAHSTYKPLPPPPNTASLEQFRRHSSDTHDTCPTYIYKHVCINTPLKTNKTVTKKS